MSALTELSVPARRTVANALAPGEPVIFTAAPDADAAARAQWPVAAAGALLMILGAPLVWIAGGAAWHAFTLGSFSLLASLLALLSVAALLGGAYLALTPWAAARRARDTVILVTDRRVTVLSLRGRDGLNLPGRSILGVERLGVERGFGTLEVRHEEVGHAAETRLTGLSDVLGAESAIRRLVLDRSITIITP